MNGQECDFKITSGEMYIDCSGCKGKGTLSSNKCLRNTMELLLRERVNRIHYLKDFYQRIYYREQIEPLYEFIDIINALKAEEPWEILCRCSRHREWKTFLRNILEKETVINPAKAYWMLSSLREQYNETHILERHPPSCVKSYTGVMDYLLGGMEKASIIRECIQGKQVHDYIKPVVQPSFISSIIEHRVPEGARLLDKYSVMGSDIRIFENGSDRFYFISPSELTLSFNEVKILHNLKDSVSDKYVYELIDPLEARNYFRKLGAELLSEFDGGLDREKLSEIFTRYTAGYGILEILFSDDRVRDVYVDSPTSLTPIYVDHESYGICSTNLKLSEEDLERISSKFRSIGGRPFDEANPVMDMELQDIGVRVAGVREPSTFDGIAFAFRKRRDKPWTLPMFVREGMMSAKSAAVLSFLVGGKCSILVTGARGSGKTSLLTALMSEIRRFDRIVLMEDTPEIPVNYFKSHGWKIEHLRNQPPVMRNSISSYELSPEQNLRAALRLGESVLILGEVRGPEARALFEAMRVGAAGNAVLGTIHGSTPYDTWDRVTNDLQVPSTSFKAVDIVLSLGYREDGENMLKKRYLVGITEVKKVWESNPQTEGAFFDIMRLENQEEKLQLNNSLLLNKIAVQKNMSLDECLQNIIFREKMINDLVLVSERFNLIELLEVENVVEAYSEYFSLFNGLMSEGNGIDYDRLHGLWRRWLRDYVDGLLPS